MASSSQKTDFDSSKHR
ncbi:unnamed protein product, partial [Rotaria sp. Silwood1]